ncbi:hypothetical protein G3A_17350 [Bacillus sp. 17376]|nr:hypothetical protein G3A_17350 [Bacillus sp. 17376]
MSIPTLSVSWWWLFSGDNFRKITRKTRKFYIKRQYFLIFYHNNYKSGDTFCDFELGKKQFNLYIG